MSDLSDEKYRKLFIGGLHPHTDDDALREYYSKWGNLTDCVVMRDAQSGKSRKFGFVTYETAEMVDKAQANRPHTINNKTVESKRAMPRSEASNSEAHQTVDRIFVRGLKDLGQEDLEQYFSEYGTVEKVDVIKNKDTGKSKGFGFVKFNDYDAVDKVLLYEHNCKGVRIQAKKALQKNQMESNGAGGGYGGYGGNPYNSGGGGDWGANYGAGGGNYGAGNWGNYQNSERDFGGYGGGRDWNRGGGGGWGAGAGNNSDWYGGDQGRAGGPMRGGRDMNRSGPYSGGGRGRGGGRGGFRGGR